MCVCVSVHARICVGGGGGGVERGVAKQSNEPKQRKEGTAQTEHVSLPFVHLSGALSQLDHLKQRKHNRERGPRRVPELLEI